jgi:hypothetical protein
MYNVEIIGYYKKHQNDKNVSVKNINLNLYTMAGFNIESPRAHWLRRARKLGSPLLVAALARYLIINCFDVIELCPDCLLGSILIIQQHRPGLWARDNQIVT